MKVLLTGSSAWLARALLPRLCASPAITQVTGIDLRPAHYTHAKFTALRADFRDLRVAALLPQHDALVHLAYVVLRGRMREADMHAVNVTGSLGLLQAARSAGLPRIVHLSSAAVYGSGANLAEDAPQAPLPAFCYGQHKAELEGLLERSVPECILLRPHVILGPHAQPVLRQILGLPFYLRLDDPQPLLQCVHEGDVATAVLACLQREASGAFNLAAADAYTLRAVARQRHRAPLPLPVAGARAALTIAHGIFGWGGEPGWLDGLRHTLTLDCRRAARDLGWHPAYSAAQALAATR